MNILVDVGHPAHVHLYKNFIKEMEKKGHLIIVTQRKKEVTDKLLNYYNINYINTVGYANKNYKKILLNLKRAYILRKLIIKNDIDIGMGIGDYPLAWATKGKKCKAIIFADGANVHIDKYVTFPFADWILTPTSFLKDLGPKQIRYDGYHELAYLHPNWFKPDPSVLDEMNIGKHDKYVIIRFISWSAGHDVWQTGFGKEEKIKFIKEIEKKAIPMITSEGQIPRKLKKYRIKIPPNRIHDAMYYASLYFGESQTMATEAALLGVPCVRCNSFAKSPNEELNFIELEEKYNLLYNFNIRHLSYAIKKVIHLLNNKRIKKEWQERRQRLLKDKIDVTKFFIWFFEKYPESISIIKKNPTYQKKFK